jgi:hypothetical protein
MKTRQKSDSTAFKQTSIEAQVANLLNGSSYFRGRELGLSLEYSDGVLVVRGQVPSFYLKQVYKQC